ncbi:uncharacterized protein [Temnothorax nylanderi]|uniref:uncharacterized protein n=1 Tax=Temnothorax nylanderi TaxID=102681 RepID=UPI003A856D6B
MVHLHSVYNIGSTNGPGLWEHRKRKYLERLKLELDRTHCHEFKVNRRRKLGRQSLEPEAAGEKAEWLKRDAKAQGILVTRIEQGPLTHLLSCTSSKEMWSKLKSVYDKESVVSVHLLQQKFFMCEYKDESMSVFLSKLEEIRTKLKQAGEPISDKMLMTKILMSLPEPYKHFRSAWESVPLEKQTTEELTSRLLIEEKRVSSSEGEAVALAGTSSSRSTVMVKYVQWRNAKIDCLGWSLCQKKKLKRTQQALKINENLEHVKSVLLRGNIKFFDDSASFVCEKCLAGKQHRTPFPLSSSRATERLELVHADVCGPMEQNSLGGARYFLLLKDDYSSYKSVFFIKNKSDVKACIEKFIARAERETGCKLKVLRTDNGLEFVNSELKAMCWRVEV